VKARARSRYRRICYGEGDPPEDGLRRFELLLAAHLTFIIADIFFRLAALIAFRPVDFFETGATFPGSGLTFCLPTKRLFWLDYSKENWVVNLNESRTVPFEHIVESG
jgi:hypothetical protein